MPDPRTIGPYTIERELGRGGMGVVSLATDTKLGRKVAIKELPEELATTPDRLARLQREARTLASVNHPNVAQIYGVEEEDGRTYLVLELVEGETLAERLDRGPIPTDDAMEIAARIAAGVEAAHAVGVIHRDLKPANIKITPSGDVKVLDFGLAKATDAGSSIASSTESPTLTTPNFPHAPTIPGAVLGTAAYMSPEQARGRHLDERTDIWSFGVVLYEMLAGAAPFNRESAADTLGAILHTEPDWARLPGHLPASVALLLRRCLHRDRNRRLQSVADARAQLELARDEPGETSVHLAGVIGDGGGGRRGRWSSGLVALLVLAAAALGIAGAWLMQPRPEAPRTMHLSLPLPEDVAQVAFVAVSPDDETVAWVGAEGVGSRATLMSAVYLRSLHEDRVRRLPDTNGAQAIQFSPDGERLLVWLFDGPRSRLVARVYPLTGGPSTDAVESAFDGDLMIWSVAWENDDTLMILSRDGSTLYRLPSGGGTLTPVHELEWEGDVPFKIDVVGPERRHALISTLRAETSGTADSLPRIHWLDLETGEQKLLVSNGVGASIMPSGELCFGRVGDSSSLISAPIDLEAGELTGPPVARYSGLSTAIGLGTNVLAYVPSEEQSSRGAALIEFGLDGSRRVLHDSFAFYADPHVSPDGSRIAFQAIESDAGLPRVWMLDMTSRLVRPMTAPSERAGFPRWLADGRLTYTRRIDDPSKRVCMVMEGRPGATAQPLFPSRIDERMAFAQLTPDGQYAMVGYSPVDGREGGIYVHRVGSDEPLRPFFASPAVEGYHSFSPDGQWVVYHTNSSGVYEVYLRRMAPDDPDSHPIYPVSKGGGGWPSWSPDGRSIYFSGAQDILRVDLELEGEVSITTPTMAVDLQELVTEAHVFPSADRFVGVEAASPSRPQPSLRVVLDWSAAWSR